MLKSEGNVDCNTRQSFERLVIDSYKKVLPAESKLYKLGCKIGAGTFSTLWLAECKKSDDRNLYVIKKLDVDKLTTKDLKNLQYEVQLSSQLNHPYILAFYSSFVADHGCIWTVYPFYNFGSCRDVIASEFKNGLPLLFVGMVLRFVVLALQYLHRMGFLHRAVNASHILLNSDNTVCLSGLRHCLMMPDDGSNAHDFPDNAIQVLPWVAPEVLQQNLTGYNDRSDIYSLGITAVELVTGTIPYSKLRPTEILLQKIRGVIPQLPDKATIEELHGDFSNSQSSLDGLQQTNDMLFSPQITAAPSKKVRNLHQFVEVCLQADASSRPSASQLKQSSYIRNVKRKMKDKDCQAFTDLLKPLTPINEFISDTENKGLENEMEILEKVPNVTLCDETRWNF
ncbi:STE20-related kinase adapter protein alpha-like [Hydractinia symbiolongicarpus]|uniref:STE20-related kinase adapter protein alpha-like n=1 Tax=Hydractinia symbiolongicarpus TaxID=13093 RepID=UPI0025511DA7|nr:STE20-related kinase adapter protein alpha-like [Hydractinia symbiolongicarpus]